jgi:hypothetical protein
MLMGGKTAGPVLKESKVNIYELLKLYEPNDTLPVKVLVDSITNDIFLAYDTTFHYAVNEVNFDFDRFSASMNTSISNFFEEGTLMSNILTWLDDEYITLHDTINIVYGEKESHPYDLQEELTKNSEFGLEGKQKLDHIKFIDTNIIITIDPSFDIKTDTLLTLEIEIPGIDEPLNVNVKPNRKEYTFKYKEFNVDAKGDFKFTFKLKGDGQTKVKADDEINCGISFKSVGENSRYAVYGWFNYYQYREIKADTLNANLKDYLPAGTQLSIAEPQIDFKVKSNFGVPITFGLDTITAEFQTGAPKTFNRAPKYYIDQAKEEEVKTLPVIIDNSFFENGGMKFSEFINTELNSLRFFYSFVTNTKDKDGNLDLSLPMQFISSDTEIAIDAKLKIPLAFGDNSVLCYEDTIDLDIDTESLKDVDRFELRFNYTNHLPIGFYVDLYLIGENNKNILKNDSAYQTIKIDKADVYTEGDRKGEVDESKFKLTPVEYRLTFTKDSKTSISKIQEAKYMLLKYRSVEEGVPGEPIRLKASDFLSLSLNFFIDGKILISNE